MYKPTGIPSIVFAYYKQFFTSEDVKWWTGVMWITCELISCFISCLDSHSDGTHLLQRILLVIKWNNAKFLKIYSDEENKSWMKMYILDDLMVSTI